MDFWGVFPRDFFGNFSGFILCNAVGTKAGFSHAVSLSFGHSRCRKGILHVMSPLCGRTWYCSQGIFFFGHFFGICWGFVGDF